MSDIIVFELFYLVLDMNIKVLEELKIIGFDGIGEVECVCLCFIIVC